MFIGWQVIHKIQEKLGESKRKRLKVSRSHAARLSCPSICDVVLRHDAWCKASGFYSRHVEGQLGVVCSCMEFAY